MELLLPRCYFKDMLRIGSSPPCTSLIGKVHQGDAHPLAPPGHESVQGGWVQCRSLITRLGLQE